MLTKSYHTENVIFRVRRCTTTQKNENRNRFIGFVQQEKKLSLLFYVLRLYNNKNNEITQSHTNKHTHTFIYESFELDLHNQLAVTSNRPEIFKSFRCVSNSLI